MATPPQLRRLTVTEAVQEYLTSVQRAVLGGSLAVTTQASYARDLTEFVALAGPDTVLDDLSAEDIDDLVLAYAAQPDKRYSRRTKPGPHGAPGRGPGAQARFRQAISRLFTHAERRGWIQLNPMPDTVVRPRVRGLADAARSALPEVSAAALLHVPQEVERAARKDQRLSARDAAILRLLLEVGPRVSELCAADRSDLHERDGATWLVIRRGKGGKARDLPLSPSTATALRDYLTARRPAPPTTDSPERVEDAERALFVSYRGRRLQPRDVQNLISRLCRHLPAETRRQVTPHGLRHTAATLLLSSGAADVKTVQHLLGHASLATTGIYLDEVSEEMVRAVAAHPVTG
jgi:site-specific recombinase XerD